MYSDNDTTYRAYRDQRDGNCEVVEARDIVFYHRHHCTHPEVPHDATYKWQNRQQAYRAGAELFWKRNPDAYRTETELWL
jgi:hypothetical protein